MLKTLNFAAMDAEMERRYALPETDAGHPDGFSRDDTSGGWDVWWGGYPYWIEDARMKSHTDLLRWLHHICAKGWEGATPERVSRFIEAVCDHTGQALYPATTGADL